MDTKDKNLENKANSNFSDILYGLDNQWVILSENQDRVITASSELELIADRMNEGILLKVPDSTSYLAPSNNFYK